MAEKTIDIILNMHPDQAALARAKSGIKGVEKSLKDVEMQANRTREKMQKLAQVGKSMAMIGGAITAPFALAMKKYVDTAKETEPTSRRILELSKRWEESQVRIGRVTAEIVLPTLEKALDIVDKIAIFAENNPGAIKAAVGIGGTLIVLGGMLSTAASIVSTIATVQGLAAGLGIGGAAAGGGTAAITTAIAGIAPAVGTAIVAILSSPLTWAIAALALTVPIMNYLLGTNQTWKDIAETGRKALILIGYGVDRVIKGIGSSLQNLGQMLWNGLVKLATSVVEGIGGGIARLISRVPARADGGYMPTGLYNVSEGGRREFAMSNSTTKAAENMIGGQLTQQRLLQSLSGNKRISYYDNRRIDSSLSANDRRIIAKDTLNILGGVI